MIVPANVKSVTRLKVLIVNAKYNPCTTINIYIYDQPHRPSSETE